MMTGTPRNSRRLAAATLVAVSALALTACGGAGFSDPGEGSGDQGEAPDQVALRDPVPRLDLGHGRAQVAVVLQLLDQDMGGRDDPRLGRLTANFFVRGRPRG